MTRSQQKRLKLKKIGTDSSLRSGVFTWFEKRIGLFEGSYEHVKTVIFSPRR